jgi:Cu/Ag efflux pump CusA
VLRLYRQSQKAYLVLVQGSEGERRMMRALIESSLKLRFPVIVVALACLVVGAVQLRAMPVDLYPEFNPPLVEVQTEALGLAADEVEALITTPMEADLLNGVAWLDQIYSESVTGLSRILLVFEPGTDPIQARQMVQERLTQAHALPNVSKPPVMLQPLSASSRVMMVGLSSTNLSLIDMGVLARWNIRPRLMGVPGVANVVIWGQRERQLQVQVDPKTLHEKGVTLNQVIQTAGEALWVSPLTYLESSKPGTAGWIDTPNQRLGIHHLLPISSPDDLSQVAVADSEGLLLGDVAKVVEDHQPLIGDAALTSGLGLILVIEKSPGASTLDVTRGVEEALQAMAPGLGGVAIDTTLYRSATYLESAISNLSFLLLIGAVLLALVLAGFFFQWRTALVSMLAIPIAFTAATLVLYFRGVPFNAMVLAGLVMAFGAIIDDAVIDTEHIAQRLRQARQENSAESAVSIIVSAVGEMRGATMFATLIIVLIGVPFFFLDGLAGAFFQPLAVSYLLALATSMLVALVITPTLSLTLFANAPIERSISPLATGLVRSYHSLLARLIKAPAAALTLAIVVSVIGIAALPMMRLSLVPEFRQSQLLIEWEAAPGTSRAEMNRIATQVSNELAAIAGVRNVGSHVDRAETGDQAVGINSGQLWFTIDAAANYEATVAAVDQALNDYPGIMRTLQTYQPVRLDGALTAPDQDLVVRVYGFELDLLRAKTQEVQQAIAAVEGVANARVDSQPEEPQVQIQVDLAKAEQYGIKPGDVRHAATTLLSGLQVGNLFEEQKVFDVVVWGTPEIRSSLTTLSDLLIDTPNGDQVRLGDVANVQIVPAPTIIKREAVSRFMDVAIDVNGRDLGAVTADIKNSLRSISQPKVQTRRIVKEKRSGIIYASPPPISALSACLRRTEHSYAYPCSIPRCNTAPAAQCCM